MVPFEWAENTYKALVKNNVRCTFHSYPKMVHENTKEELDALKEWISNLISFHTVE